MRQAIICVSVNFGAINCVKDFVEHCIANVVTFTGDPNQFTLSDWHATNRDRLVLGYDGAGVVRRASEDDRWRGIQLRLDAPINTANTAD